MAFQFFMPPAQGTLNVHHREEDDIVPAAWTTRRDLPELFMWKGWNRRCNFRDNPEYPVPEKGKRVVSLSELACYHAGEHLPFELVEQLKQVIPENLQLKVAYWSFPRLEKDILLYCYLANGTDEEFNRGEELYQTPDAIENVVQIGFHLSANIPIRHDVRYDVNITFDRLCITNCECNCGFTSGWCSHVIAVCLFRIRKPHRVKLRHQFRESLSQLSRIDLQKFAQHLIAQLPPSYYTGAQDMIDDLLSRRPTSIQITEGAPDPTAGGTVDDDATWYLNKHRLTACLHKIFESLSVFFPDFNRGFMRNEPVSNAYVEYRNICRGSAHQEPPALWNLFSIVVELLKRRDTNSLSVLYTITEELLKFPHLLTRWYSAKISLYGEGGPFHLRFSGEDCDGYVHDLITSAVCDEIVSLWRIAALNPFALIEDRIFLRQLFVSWHLRILTGLFVLFNGGEYQHQPSVGDIYNFPGFKPAMEVCDMTWDAFEMEGFDGTEHGRIVEFDPEKARGPHDAYPWTAGLQQNLHDDLRISSVAKRLMYVCEIHSERIQENLQKALIRLNVLDIEFLPQYPIPARMYEEEDPIAPVVDALVYHALEHRYRLARPEVGLPVPVITAGTNGASDNESEDEEGNKEAPRSSSRASNRGGNAERGLTIGHRQNNAASTVEGEAASNELEQNEQTPRQNNAASTVEGEAASMELEQNEQTPKRDQPSAERSVGSDNMNGATSDTTCARDASCDGRSLPGCANKNEAITPESAPTELEAVNATENDHAGDIVKERGDTPSLDNADSLDKAVTVQHEATSSNEAAAYAEGGSSQQGESADNENTAKEENNAIAASSINATTEDRSDGDHIKPNGDDVTGFQGSTEKSNDHVNLPSVDVTPEDCNADECSPHVGDTEESVEEGEGDVIDPSVCASPVSCTNENCVEPQNLANQNDNIPDIHHERDVGSSSTDGAESNGPSADEMPAVPVANANLEDAEESDESSSDIGYERDVLDAGNEIFSVLLDGEVGLKGLLSVLECLPEFNGKQRISSPLFSETEGEDFEDFETNFPDCTRGIFDNVKMISDEWELMFTTAQALVAYGFQDEGLPLIARLAHSLVVNPPNFRIRFGPNKYKKRKGLQYVNPLSLRTSILIQEFMQKCYYMVKLLVPVSKYSAVAVRLAMVCLELTRPPAFLKHIEVNLFTLERNILSVAKKAKSSKNIFEVFRVFAARMKQVIQKTKGDVLMPYSMSNLFFDCAVRRRHFESEGYLSTDTDSAIEIANAVLIMKPKVYEQDHPMFCTGLRKQRSDLLIDLLFYYRREPCKLAGILGRFVDTTLDPYFALPVDPAYFHISNRVRHVGLSIDEMSIFTPRILHVQNARNHAINLVTPSTSGASDTQPSTSLEAGKKSNTKAKRGSPNQPSDSLGYIMIELGKSLLARSGYVPHQVTFGQQFFYNIPEHVLFLCAAHVMFYGIGIMNSADPKWTERCYSAFIPILEGTLLQTGVRGLKYLLENWRGHLTTAEVMAIGETASQFSDSAVSDYGVKILYDGLHYPGTLTSLDITRALIRVKDRSDYLLMKALHVIENMAKKTYVDPDILMHVAKYWFDLHVEYAGTPLRQIPMGVYHTLENHYNPSQGSKNVEEESIIKTVAELIHEVLQPVIFTDCFTKPLSPVIASASIVDTPPLSAIPPLPPQNVMLQMNPAMRGGGMPCGPNVMPTMNNGQPPPLRFPLHFPQTAFPPPPIPQPVPQPVSTRRVLLPTPPTPPLTGPLQMQPQYQQRPLQYPQQQQYHMQPQQYPYQQPQQHMIPRPMMPQGQPLRPVGPLPMSHPHQPFSPAPLLPQIPPAPIETAEESGSHLRYIMARVNKYCHTKLALLDPLFKHISEHALPRDFPLHGHYHYRFVKKSLTIHIDSQLQYLLQLKPTEVATINRQYKQALPGFPVFPPYFSAAPSSPDLSIGPDVTALKFDQVDKGTFCLLSAYRVSVMVLPIYASNINEDAEQCLIKTPLYTSFIEDIKWTLEITKLLGRAFVLHYASLIEYYMCNPYAMFVLLGTILNFLTSTCGHTRREYCEQELAQYVTKTQKCFLASMEDHAFGNLENLIVTERFERVLPSALQAICLTSAGKKLFREWLDSVKRRSTGQQFQGFEMAIRKACEKLHVSVMDE